MRLEELGLIGNCQASALIDRRGAIVWSCLPRFDAEPCFASLLDDQRGGELLVGPADGSVGGHRYLENTNVLETTFESSDGVFRVIDFFPRFIQNERTFRPTQIFRVIEPISGTPLVRVKSSPRLGWSGATPEEQCGSHHVEYMGFASRLRLTTDVPLSYLDGRPFVLTERRHVALTWGAPIEEPLAPMAIRFLENTVSYWRRWVKHCNVPARWQAEVIRSALALKLHCYEDTGAIVAAMTTSIPESRGAGRTWDYRYCWLRDAYYAVDAFRLLGHFEEREGFLSFLLNVAANAPDLKIAPLYRVDGRSDLEEMILTNWRGYEGEGPVRIGNGAALHEQHDVYGEMVLALAPIFLDERFVGERSPGALRVILDLARRALAVAGTPDAGIWEYRTTWTPQTFSTLMCWAAADRGARIASRHAVAQAPALIEGAEHLRAQILRSGWNATRGSLVGSYGGSDLDASLLQMVPLRFLPPDDPRLIGTVDTIARDLLSDGWLLRYRHDDGFGHPAVAFVLCTFWLVEALAAIGRTDEAREIMERALAARSPLGLLSEDFSPQEGRLWGNFPQVYSHVGLIHSAFAASPRWVELL